MHNTVSKGSSVNKGSSPFFIGAAAFVLLLFHFLW